MSFEEKSWERLSNAQLINEGILEIGDGYRAKNSELDSEGLPFARAGNIKNGFQFEGADLLSKKSVIKAKEKVSQVGDCVITTKGTFGRVAYVREDTEKFAYSPQLCFWRSNNSEKLDSRFLFYWLQGPDFLAQAFQVKSSTDMADYANLTDQRAMSILCPNVNTQRKIAAILSAYDDLIENNKRRIALLEKMAEEIYREWFVRFRFPGYQQAEFEKGIPKGWEMKKLPALAKITYGFPFKSDRFNSDRIGKPIVRIRNIPGSKTEDFTEEQADDKYLIQTGDMLIGMDGEFHMNHWYGPEAYLVQRVCKVKAKEAIFSGYIYRALRAPIKHYESILMGATVGHLGAKHLNDIDILVPPKGIQEKLHIFSDIEVEKKQLSLMNRQLSGTKNLLLPRLISGKLSVEELDIQFPPSMQEEVAA